MKLTQLVARHITEAVHGNWTEIYLDDVIADVTYAEAVTIPPALTNSIAMLVHHIAFYNDVVFERLKGNNPSIDSSNGFAVNIANEQEWQQLKENCYASFKRLADAVAILPEEKLYEQALYNPEDTYYKTFHGIAEHAHYHLGQIVLLKKIIRNHQFAN
jgi:hypothetical protein